MNAIQVRKNTINQAQQYLARKPLYLDTETTGYHDTDQIVEICIIDHDGQVLLDSLVKPIGSIPFGAVQIHGITNEMVQDAPTWPEIWPQVHSLLTGRSVGIYNATFDLRLIQQSHQISGLASSGLKPEAGAQAFCIMKLYARYYGEWNHRRRSYQWQSLEAAGKQCQLSLSNTHRARDDTLLARAVLRHMAQTNT
ncbi:3'-5' exonuclease [Chloroflexi bacterium TSY]|nr:3'-5' exonuclease [Chloroflexi bacterium TSY]